MVRRCIRKHARIYTYVGWHGPSVSRARIIYLSAGVVLANDLVSPDPLERVYRI